MHRLIQAIRQWLLRKRDPEAPYAGVRVPLRKGPSGRDAAVALEQPKE